VTLCPKCHSAEEKVSDIIAKLPEKYHPECVAIRQAQLKDSWMIHAKKCTQG